MMKKKTTKSNIDINSTSTKNVEVLSIKIPDEEKYKIIKAGHDKNIELVSDYLDKSLETIVIQRAVIYGLLVALAILAIGFTKYCKAAEFYVSAGIGESNWSDSKNTRFYSFPDEATCVPSRGCKGYTQEVMTNDSTRSWQVFGGIKPLSFLAAEIGYFNLGSSNVAFILNGSYTDCLFSRQGCTGTFSEHLSFKVSGLWARLPLSFSFWKVQLRYIPGVAFAKIKTFDSSSSYNLKFNDGTTHSGEARRNEAQSKNIFTQTFGVSFQVSDKWIVGGEYTPKFKIKYLADQGGDNAPGEVNIMIKTIMITLERSF